MQRADQLASKYLTTLTNQLVGAHGDRSSGFARLDQDIPAWLHEDRLVVVAGRPGTGKSAWAQQLAEYVASHGRATLFFSLEMSAQEIAERSVARTTGITVSQQQHPHRLTIEQWEHIQDALERFAKTSLWIDDHSASLVEILATIERLAQTDPHPWGLVVVDYVQLVEASGANRNLEIGAITRGLKRLATKLHVPVVALSQLNRAVDGRENKRPTLRDLRESGNIEQDADLVLFLYRPSYYTAKEETREDMEIIVAKNRHGARGITQMQFVGHRLQYRDVHSDIEIEKEILQHG